MHGCLEILGLQEFDVDLDVLWETTNKEVGLHVQRKGLRMDEERVKVFLVILHGRDKGKTS